VDWPSRTHLKVEDGEVQPQGDEEQSDDHKCIWLALEQLLRPGFVDVVLVGPEARVHERTREDQRAEHDVSRVLDSLLKPVGLDEVVERDGETDPPIDEPVTAMPMASALRRKKY
jgi:hypothetical protein